MKPTGAENIQVCRITHRNGQEPKLIREHQNLLIVEKAIATMQTQKEGDLDVQALARELDINYRTFRLRFHQFTGSSPHRYLLDLRLAHARNLLTQTSQTVKKIARRIGFKDEFYFCRFFKKRVGMTPSQWRFHSSPSESNSKNKLGRICPGLRHTSNRVELTNT